MTAASATTSVINGFVLRDAPAYREVLPHNVMLTEYVCLLITPLRPTWVLPMARPKAALGAVFDVTPPNIEVKSEADCTFQSELIEGLFHMLPEGSAPLKEAADLMLENKFGCLPVCEGQRLVGILTESDFVRHVAESL